MTEPELKQRPSKLALAVDFVKSRLGTLLILGGIAAVAWGYFDPSFTVSREAKIVLLSFIGAGVPLGLLSGNYITSILYDPTFIWLIDLDARRLDGGLYAIPYADFKELTVTDEEGEPNDVHDITQLTPQLYVGKKVDLQEMTVVGTWRGTLDDRELARSLQKVRECRNQLEEDAKRGFAIETSAFTIVRNAAREATLDVIESFQEGTLPDAGDSLNGAVDDALEDYGLEEELDNELTPEAVDAEEVSTSPEEEAGAEDANGAEVPADD
ncbi:hypothetical protein [Natronomonas amylolytica]|uniref:hypothetical protein n=1 Tax=Natronomonas amylolytica TaxID=3108498 RepID=UPI003009B25F